MAPDLAVYHLSSLAISHVVEISGAIATSTISKPSAVALLGLQKRRFQDLLRLDVGRSRSVVHAIQDRS